MYKLVGYPQTRATRVAWMLEEIGADYEIEPAPPQSDAARAYNPTGKVPVLVDPDAGLTISDSVAILTYLGDRHGVLTFPAGTPERGRQDSLTQFCVDEVEGALWTAAKHSFALPEEVRCKEVKPACKFEFDRAMATLETRLGDGPFAMGETFTIPDILFAHCANWAEFGTKWPLPGGKVGDYLGRVRTRPALARAEARLKSEVAA